MCSYKSTFERSDMTLTLGLKLHSRSQKTLLYQRHPVGKIRARVGLRREGKFRTFFKKKNNSAITFIFDLETWFKVTAHLSLKCSVYVTY